MFSVLGSLKWVPVYIVLILKSKKYSTVYHMHLNEYNCSCYITSSTADDMQKENTSAGIDININICMRRH